jgi:PleD family two-component response regulator
MIDSTLKNANILIVDDQQSNIDLLDQFLQMQGFTSILSTTDPLMAVGLFKSFDPDLILLDLMMPQLSGYEVMDQLKPLIPPDSYFPVLVLTADVSPSAKQRALARGARDFITKPFDFLEVFLRIRNLLETRYLYQQLEKKNQILEEKMAMVIKVMAGWNRE